MIDNWALLTFWGAAVWVETWDAAVPFPSLCSADSGSISCHQGKMVALVWWILWLNLCTVGGMMKHCLTLYMSMV